jgi:hypothetical protein
MITTPQIPSLEAIGDLGEISTNPQGFSDVFSQKVGEWAFANAVPTVHNKQPDVPNRFATAPLDGVVMDFIEDHIGRCNTLPVGHLYDAALENLANKYPDLSDLLQDDLTLRQFLKERRIGEMYE